jgi:hypothetical protein
MGTLAVRYWWTRNLAFNGGLAFGVGETRVWGIGVLGGNSMWGALSNLFVRYYL